MDLTSEIRQLRKTIDELENIDKRKKGYIKEVIVKKARKVLASLVKKHLPIDRMDSSYMILSTDNKSVMDMWVNSAIENGWKVGAFSAVHVVGKREVDLFQVLTRK